MTKCSASSRSGAKRCGRSAIHLRPIRKLYRRPRFVLWILAMNPSCYGRFAVRLGQQTFNGRKIMPRSSAPFGTPACGCEAISTRTPKSRCGRSASLLTRSGWPKPGRPSYPTALCPPNRCGSGEPRSGRRADFEVRVQKAVPSTPLRIKCRVRDILSGSRSGALPAPFASLQNGDLL
jgi:hypothetical protein